MKELPHYLSQATLSRRFGVTRATVANWIIRYPYDGDRLPVPEPDAFIDGRGIWLEDSWWKWQNWKQRLDLFKVQRYSIDISPELLTELSTRQIQVRGNDRIE